MMLFFRVPSRFILISLALLHEQSKADATGGFFPAQRGPKACKTCANIGFIFLIIIKGLFIVGDSPVCL